MHLVRQNDVSFPLPFRNDFINLVDTHLYVYNGIQKHNKSVVAVGFEEVKIKSVPIFAKVYYLASFVKSTNGSQDYFKGSAEEEFIHIL